MGWFSKAAHKFNPFRIVGNAWDDLTGNSARKQANATNIRLQHEQQDWEERMSSTSWQRGVKDMLAAGMNPMLAYSQGGSSTPTVSAATVQPENTGMLEKLISVNSARMASLQRDQLEAQTEVARATARKTNAEAATEEAWSARSGERVNDLMNLTKKQIEETISRFNLTDEQRRQVHDMLPELIRKAKAEATVSEYGVPSARAEAEWWKDLGELGKGAEKGGNFAKVLSEIMRTLVFTFRRND